MNVLLEWLCIRAHQISLIYFLLRLVLSLLSYGSNMCQNCHSPFDADVNYYKRDYFIWLPVKQQVIKLVLVKALKLRILFVDRFIKIWLEVGKCSKIICPCNLI